MRQLTYTGNSSVRWEETGAPPGPQGREALVRPLAVARCDLDVAMVTQDLFPGPFSVGHEAVAEVLEVGGDVALHGPGDRVLLPFQLSCGACAHCIHERYAACATYRGPAGAMFGFGAAGGGHGGALADALLVPVADHMLLAAPASLSPAALATLPDNVVDAYRCVVPALLEHPGSDVLIVGGAFTSIGLYAAAMALATGAGRVTYYDSDESRCTIAAALGATAVRREGAWPRRLDRAPITVDGSGCDEGLLLALQSTEPFGVCTSAAIYFSPVALPLLELYTRGITFHTSRADSRRFLPAVLGLAAAGSFDPLAVPTTTVPWEAADEAWTMPATKLVVLR